MSQRRLGRSAVVRWHQRWKIKLFGIKLIRHVCMFVSYSAFLFEMLSMTQRTPSIQSSMETLSFGAIKILDANLPSSAGTLKRSLPVWQWSKTYRQGKMERGSTLQKMCGGSWFWVLKDLESFCREEWTKIPPQLCANLMTNLFANIDFSIKH